MEQQQYTYNVPDSVKDNPRVQRWFDEMLRDAAGDYDRLLHNLKAVCGYLIQADTLRVKMEERNKELIEQTNGIFADLFTALDTRESELQNENKEAVAKAFGIAAEPQAKYGK